MRGMGDQKRQKQRKVEVRREKLRKEQGASHGEAEVRS
jgi:hypothetical protein